MGFWFFPFFNIYPSLNNKIKRPCQILIQQNLPILQSNLFITTKRHNPTKTTGDVLPNNEVIACIPIFGRPKENI